MAHNNLQTVLIALSKNFKEIEQLIGNADKWVSIFPPHGVPKFSRRHQEFVIEMAFLRAFLAWEVFLEEAFTLYLLGKKPPKGKMPHRHFSCTTRKMVDQLLLPEGKSYITWAVASIVTQRSERFFKDGKPFSTALKSHTNMFDEIRTIRNAIAHWHSTAQDKFKKLVRNKSGTGTFPPALTVGGFLGMRVPGMSPPETFLEAYLNRIRIVVDEIIPS